MSRCSDDTANGRRTEVERNGSRGAKSRGCVKEARFYVQEENDAVHCLLCPQDCHIKKGRAGFCGIRRNEDGRLIAAMYGKVSAMQMDPVEKKPLYHFFPGKEIFSIGTVGCNFRCRFCQNWHLVEAKVSVEDLSPEDAVKAALVENSIGIAYTYNEPSVWYEYVFDTAKLAREKGLKNVLVTNGFINKEPLKELLPLIDAMNIDLKFIKDDLYRKYSSGRLEPVLETIRISCASCHVEITNLLITDVNDSSENIAGIVDFVSSVSRSVPLHFSRYFPNYRMDNPPTPIDRLIEAYNIGKKKLDYVYAGNVSIPKGSDTCCPECKEVLIRRNYYRAEILNLKNGQCGKCSRPADIIL
ncbi:MAG: AmmeMemoRadiSam system radical SAM enzyme [Candidatus Omnitrophica bacterium]|nr:AmmeMemoRadiSam system radical SAM enzyme [Candidatus Omnitrophota bacterium]